MVPWNGTNRGSGSLRAAAGDLGRGGYHVPLFWGERRRVGHPLGGTLPSLIFRAGQVGGISGVIFIFHLPCYREPCPALQLGDSSHLGMRGLA